MYCVYILLDEIKIKGVYMFRIFLVKFCCRKAQRYDAVLKMLLEVKGFRLIWAIGVASINKEKWLKRAEKLQPKS